MLSLHARRRAKGAMATQDRRRGKGGRRSHTLPGAVWAKSLGWLLQCPESHSRAAQRPRELSRHAQHPAVREHPRLTARREPTPTHARREPALTPAVREHLQRRLARRRLRPLHHHIAGRRKGAPRRAMDAPAALRPRRSRLLRATAVSDEPFQPSAEAGLEWLHFYARQDNGRHPADQLGGRERTRALRDHYRVATIVISIRES